MKIKKYFLLKELTDSKLRYAQLYLEELKNSHIPGSDIEMAHQESFLFHLNGVIDPFLAELNEIYGLGIKTKNLSIKKIKAAKSGSKKKPIQEAKKLNKLMNKKNWLSELKSFKPHTVQIVKNGEKDEINDEKEIVLEEISQIPINPLLEKFEEWHVKMSQLIFELRESAIHASGNSSKIEQRS